MVSTLGQTQVLTCHNTDLLDTKLVKTDSNVNDKLHSESLDAVFFPDKSRPNSYREATISDNSIKEGDSDDQPNNFVNDDNTYWWDRDNSEAE